MEKIKPLTNQKVRNGQLQVIGEQPPSNSKIQNKVNEMIKTINSLIEVLNNGKD